MKTPSDSGPDWPADLEHWAIEAKLLTTTIPPDGMPLDSETLDHIRACIAPARELGIDVHPLLAVLRDGKLHNQEEMHLVLAAVNNLKAAGMLPEAGARQRPARTPAAAQTHQEEPHAAQRFWMQQHCPNCGATDLRFKPITEFHDTTGIPLTTIRRRMNAGVYCQDKLNQLPWCAACREKTPEGPGVERRVEGLPAFQMDKPQMLLILEWVRNLIVARYKLPKLEIDRIHRLNSPAEQLAWDLLTEGAGAVFASASRKNEFPSRPEAEAIAASAIDDFKKNPQQFKRPPGAATFDRIITGLDARKIL